MKYMLTENEYLALKRKADLHDRDCLQPLHKRVVELEKEISALKNEHQIYRAEAEAASAIRSTRSTWRLRRELREANVALAALKRQHDERCKWLKIWQDKYRGLVREAGLRGP